MEFYTVEEVAGILKTTEHTIRKYIRNGQLSAYKVGKAWRIEKKDLGLFLDTCRTAPPVKEKLQKTRHSRPEQRPPLAQVDRKEEPAPQAAVPERLNPKPPEADLEEGIIAIRKIPIEPLPCPKCGHTVCFQGPCPECGETYQNILAFKKKKR
ncbi:MAG: helix-turn-helix domain-containing protein [Firmicutes bacterium]|jgi:putative molybdopterin biosynthesis protein|nr:helix-turn-helix domain-containing protein [Bacillota bacterium]